MAGTHHKAARLLGTAGDTPAEIEEHFADAIGKVPMMPEYGLGFWQCKLRYYNQEQVLNVARESKNAAFRWMSLSSTTITGQDAVIIVLMKNISRIRKQ